MRPDKFNKKLKIRQLFRKRICRLCREKVAQLDYKEIKGLERFINERGKIISRRSSGNCARHQRMVAQAVKRTRYLALLPYVK